MTEPLPEGSYVYQVGGREFTGAELVRVSLDWWLEHRHTFKVIWRPIPKGPA